MSVCALELRLTNPKIMAYIEYAELFPFVVAFIPRLEVYLPYRSNNLLQTICSRRLGGFCIVNDNDVKQRVEQTEKDVEDITVSLQRMVAYMERAAEMVENLSQNVEELSERIEELERAVFSKSEQTTLTIPTSLRRVQ